MSSTEEKAVKNKKQTKDGAKSSDLGIISMSPNSALSATQPIEDSFDLNLKLHHQDGKDIPKKETDQSAGFDLKANLNVGATVTFYDHNNVQREKTVTKNIEGVSRIYILPDERVLVPTGLFADIPNGLWLGIYARSGTSWKKGLIVTNSVGVVDSDYVDEIKVSITNISGSRVFIEDGERIAQCLLHEVVPVNLQVLKEKPKQKTNRTGGFGSTGHK